MVNCNNQVEYEIYTDGSCHQKSGIGGFAYATFYNNVIVNYMAGSDVDTTNNRMELVGIWKGLESIKGHHIIRIITDSQYCIQVLTSNTPETIKKNLDLIEIIRPYLLKHKVWFNLVKGHSGNAGNEMVDMWASEARVARMEEEGIECKWKHNQGGESN